MDGGPLPERLRRARTACGEDLSALSRRTGVRPHHLRAIEDGRFEDLPPGIYARSAVRAFAEAVGLDPSAALAETASLLPAVTDPIDALARRCGRSRPPATTPVPAPTVAEDGDRAQWRALAGALLDAAFVGALLTVVVMLIALVARTPVHTLRESAVPLALVGVVLGVAYFGWFGGLCGTTLGRLAVDARASVRPPAPLTLRQIAAGALLAAAADSRAIVSLGAELTRIRPVEPSRSAPPIEPGLWPLRLRGRAPVLWSPANRPAGGPPDPLPRPRG